MGRRRGDSYRKSKRKKICRVSVPHWTIREDVIKDVCNFSHFLGSKPSRYVEAVLLSSLNQSVRYIPFDRVFTKTS